VTDLQIKLGFMILTLGLVAIIVIATLVYANVEKAITRSVKVDDYTYKRLIKESSDSYYGRGSNTPEVVILVNRVIELERTVKDLPSFKAKVAKEKLEEAKAIMDSIKGDE